MVDLSYFLRGFENYKHCEPIPRLLRVWLQDAQQSFPADIVQWKVDAVRTRIGSNGMCVICDERVVQFLRGRWIGRVEHRKHATFRGDIESLEAGIRGQYVGIVGNGQ